MSIRARIVDCLEAAMRFLYRWLTTNDEILGKITYTIHLFGFYTLLVLVVMGHTVYPVFWFQTFAFFFVVLVWVQHIVLKTCVFTSLEHRLMGPDSFVMMDVLLELAGIPVQKETRMGVTVLISTAGVMFLGLELLARMSMYGRELMGMSRWV
jgi:hypothetical protein